MRIPFYLYGQLPLKQIQNWGFTSKNDEDHPLWTFSQVCTLFNFEGCPYCRQFFQTLCNPSRFPFSLYYLYYFMEIHYLQITSSFEIYKMQLQLGLDLIFSIKTIIYNFSQAYRFWNIYLLFCQSIGIHIVFTINQN